MRRIRFSKKTLKMLGIGALGLGAVGLVSGLGGYAYFSRNLPSVDQIRSDGFPLVTEVYDEHGEVIGEFSVERRYLLSYERIPKQMVDAITSAEDSDFFEHGGVDYTGIVRAALKNAESGESAQGASTITMQLAKSMLSTEKTYTRKIKQIILARQLEANFSKHDILFLYLNHVYLGRGAYGVEAASREFFGKHLDACTTGEMAMLAALPKEPSKFANPANFDRWKDRQEWILDRMAKLGKITPQDAAAEKAKTIVIQPHKDINLETAPYFVEYVRQQLVKTYGDDMVLKGGLRVYTTADAKMNRSAMKSLQDGLRGLDKRQGWRGPLKNVAKREDFPALLAELDSAKVRGLNKGGALAPHERVQALVVATDVGKGKATVAFGPDEKTERATILLRDASWAHPVDPDNKNVDPITNLGKVLKIGDVVWVQPKVQNDEDVKSKMYEAGTPYATLEQEPVVQGSMLAMDPHTGAVKMMVGGYDFSASEYNRAIQAKRQPGSSFKPVIYSAAIDKGYTPSTIIVDSPIVYADAAPDPNVQNATAGENEDDPDAGVWKPKNYGTKYYGDTTFRTALVLSRNVVTIKILQDIGIDYAAEYAKNLGLAREPAHDLSFALGSSDLSLLELSTIYSVFPNMGKPAPDPFFIKRVEARDGTLLEWHAGSEPKMRDAADMVGTLGLDAAPVPPPQTHYAETVKPESRPRGIDDAKDDILRGKALPPGYVMDPATAYVMVGLMQDVIRYGTATGANLGRPAAGKTGTTNDNGDTWFMGYTPDLVAGVWVGFDDKKPLGGSETGGHTAVPIWTQFMVDAIRGTPAKDFPQPSGIVRLQIDRESGLRSCAETDSPVWVAFKEGSEPQDYVCKRGSIPSGLPQGGTTTNGIPSGSGLPSGLPPD